MLKLKMNNVFILILVLSVNTACNQEKPLEVPNLSPSSSSTCGSGSTTDGALFEIDGKVITRNDLPERLKASIYENEYKSYSANKMIFQEYVLRYYLAKKSNKLKDENNPPQLSELLGGTKPNAKEVKLFFQQNRNRIGANVTYAQAKPQIERFMQQRNMADLFEKKVIEMEKNGVFKALTVAPIAPSIELDLAGFPTKGNKNSKIKIVEISDYTCGHCQSAHKMVVELVKKYKKQVSFTQINMALRPQGISGTYVRGAVCAQKQSLEKFWNYHDETFKVASVPHDHNKPGHKHQANEGSSKESIIKVKNIAKTVGLDLKNFSKCLTSKKTSSSVARTNQLLSSKGISGTPVFIVNGKKLAKGVYELEKVIKSKI